MRKIFYVSRQELLAILHDKGIMIFVFFVPLAYPLLYSYVYSNEVVRDVPAVVVDQCNSKLSRELTRKIDASPDVRILCRANSVEEARWYIARHEAYGVIVIPASFDKDLYRNESTHVGLYCDMSSMLYYKALLLAATDVSIEMNKDIKVERMKPKTDREEEIMKEPVTYEHVKLYNESAGFASFIIPPVLMLILQQTLLLGVGMSMGGTRERNRGLLIPFDRQYKSPAFTVIGKAIPYFTIYFIMGIYAFRVVTPMFHLPQNGDYVTFLKFLVPFLLASTFFAISLSGFVYRREDCIPLYVFLSVPFLFLSGISWPMTNMPPFWKGVGYFIPTTFGMDGYPRIATMGCSLADISRDYTMLWIQTASYFTIACLMYWYNMWIFKLRHPKFGSKQTN